MSIERTKPITLIESITCVLGGDATIDLHPANIAISKGLFDSGKFKMKDLGDFSRVLEKIKKGEDLTQTDQEAVDKYKEILKERH